MTLEPKLYGLWARNKQIPVVSVPHYNHLEQFDREPRVVLVDHMAGFDENLSNPVMHILNQRHSGLEVWTEQIIDPQVQDQYPNLQFRFDAELMDMSYLRDGHQYLNAIPIDRGEQFHWIVNCDNRAGHIGRQFLTAGLHRFGLWNDQYCTKGFVFSRSQIDGNLRHYCPDVDQQRFLRKFFIDDSDLTEQEFYLRHLLSYEPKLDQRVANLLNKITNYLNTFVTVVSETMSESYHAHVTEKFLYPVLTRSLWLGCAQPGWHARIETGLGFRKFSKIFDYDFDSITNPVLRIKSLLAQLVTLKSLSQDDLRDLYSIEKDTVDFNYYHYVSGDYLRCLRKFDR